jgi:polygalacturonase
MVVTSSFFYNGSPASNNMFDPYDYGATGDGSTLDTKAVQDAIDAADHFDEGGTVYIKPGRYLCGTLHLRSNVTLHLSAGAVILGSRNPDDYPGNLMPFRDAVGADRGKALIYAHNARNICIEGQGTIDGQGKGIAHPRPMLLRILGCTGVTVRNVTLKDSAAWVQHYLRCTDVQIIGVRVTSHCNSNNDGINLDGCQRVVVSGCHFSAGDDAFTLKCTTSTPCRDVAVSNCLFQSECNGIKFGTESIGGFENITISNCVVYDTHLCGLTVATVDGAFLRNVLISNIAMRNVGGAIFVRLGSRGYNLPKDVVQRPVGSLTGLVIRDITATGVDAIGSAILGLEDRPIEDVTLENIRISDVIYPPDPVPAKEPPAQEGAEQDVQRPIGYLETVDDLEPHEVAEFIEVDEANEAALAENESAVPAWQVPNPRTGEASAAGPVNIIQDPFPEKPAEYPQYNHWGRFPAGLYCRHIRGLRLRNVRVTQVAATDDDIAPRPSVLFIDVAELDTRD